MSGSGVTGDLLAHAVDTAEWLNAPISGVFAKAKTFVEQRKHVDSSRVEPVTIDDACFLIAEFANGSLGSFQSDYFEYNGENGAIFLIKRIRTTFNTMPMSIPNRDKRWTPTLRDGRISMSRPRNYIRIWTLGGDVAAQSAMNILSPTAVLISYLVSKATLCSSRTSEPLPELNSSATGIIKIAKTNSWVPIG